MAILGVATLWLPPLTIPAGALQGDPASFAMGRSEGHDASAKVSPLRASEVPDIDEVVPPIDSNASCALPKVLHKAGERVKELVTILPQFTATERVEHREAHKNGKWRDPQIVTFNYLAELQEVGPGMLHMEEMRNGTTSASVFPGGLADFGLPAIVLVFHPYFADEFEMSCEGLSQWEGRPAWQVHFQQRRDRAARLRVYIVKSNSFPIKLKGRAWISRDSSQVIHLETDLLDPVPEIRLVREHLLIDYEPVKFQKHNVELWLPKNADVYMNFRGRVYHRRHSFDDFLLFSVDVNQHIAEPQ